MRDDPPREDWARRNGGWVAIAALLVGGWMAVLGPGALPPPPVATGGTPGDPPRAITAGVIARMGNDAALAYLRKLNGGRALRAVEKARDAVVRFEATVPPSAERPWKPSSWGSGVLVNGGHHVLVAGHMLEPMEKYPDRKFTVTLADGRTLGARVPGVRGGVGGAPEGDWGLVELEGPPPEGYPSLEFGAAADDATVVLLGYSGALGVDASGGVLGANLVEGYKPSRPPLRPLAFVGTLTNAETGRAEIVAGVMPAGGVSGGAIIDLEGRLVAVMASYTSSRAMGTLLEGNLDDLQDLDRTKERLEFRESIGFWGTPVRVFRAFIEERWKR